MKICHVNNYCRGLHRYVGGAETAMSRTAAIARDHGHDNFFVTLKPDVEQPACDYRHYAVRRWEDYLPRLVARYVEPVKWYVWQHDHLASRDFARIMAREKPDLVHFHNVQFPGLDLVRIAAEHGAKTLLTVYDYWIFCPNVMLLTGKDEYCRCFHGAYCVDCLPRILRTPQRLLLARRRAVFDRYMRYIDRWIVLSNHSSTVLEAYGIVPDKIRLVRLTLPFEFQSLEPDDGAKVDPVVIFFAGWLQKRKGVHVLLEAMPAILKQYPQAKLRIAGLHTKFEWDYKQRIETLMAQPGLAGHVTFLGHLDSRQVEQELRQCAVVAIPEQYENMSPLLMIEAMTLARPLVISRAGGIPEFVEEGVSGWLADPRKPLDFAEKILYVLTHQGAARPVAANARQKVLTLCAEARIAEDTMAAYEFAPDAPSRIRVDI